MDIQKGKLSNEHQSLLEIAKIAFLEVSNANKKAVDFIVPLTLIATAHGIKSGSKKKDNPNTATAWIAALETRLPTTNHYAKQISAITLNSKVQDLLSGSLEVATKAAAEKKLFTLVDFEIFKKRDGGTKPQVNRASLFEASDKDVANHFKKQVDRIEPNEKGDIVAQLKSELRLARKRVEAIENRLAALVKGPAISKLANAKNIGSKRRTKPTDAQDISAVG